MPNLVDGQNTTVSISNVWVPDIPNVNGSIHLDVNGMYQGYTPGQIATANKLIMTGSASPGSTTYQTKITYYKGGADQPLKILALGIWLPRVSPT